MSPTSETAPTYPFELPKLKFAYGDLEPYMDAKTVEIHYTKHHQGYVTNLNNALKDYPALQKMSVEDLLRNLPEIPEAIRETVKNQGGGHANHQFFWKILKAGPATAPQKEVSAAIQQSFGSFDKFKTDFSAAVVKLFGSGWVFLVVDPKEAGKLKIQSLPNHDSVLARALPGLLICDVWEHAYYLKHQNRRADFLESFWNLVDWEAVEQRLLGIRSGKQQL